MVALVNLQVSSPYSCKDFTFSQNSRILVCWLIALELQMFLLKQYKRSSGFDDPALYISICASLLVNYVTMVCEGLYLLQGSPSTFTCSFLLVLIFRIFVYPLWMLSPSLAELLHRCEVSPVSVVCGDTGKLDCLQSLIPWADFTVSTEFNYSVLWWWYSWSNLKIEGTERWWQAALSYSSLDHKIFQSVALHIQCTTRHNMPSKECGINITNFCSIP